MQDKIVCPKCGQIYDPEQPRCPLCGMLAPEAPTEPLPRRRSSTPRSGSFSQPDKSQREERERYLEELERREKEQRDATRARIPRGCLIASAVLLVAALLIGGSFLLWKLGVIDLGLYSTLAPKGEPTEATAVTDCQSINLSATELTIDAQGVSRQLVATAVPESSVGTFLFESADPSVATVNANGLVTGVAAGETEITVTMGNASASCKVICSFTAPVTTEAPTEPVPAPGKTLKLNNEDMTFFGPDEFYTLKVTNADDAKVTWSSADESVATVDEDGKVVAVGDGRTLITATIGESTGECIVRCNFE